MTLVIVGDSPEVRANLQTQDYIRGVRRALVTGGRALLDRVPGTPYRGGLRDGTGAPVFAILLRPEIERRIRVSGDSLTEDEIRAGLEQLRESDEDVEARLLAERVAAFIEGGKYAVEQMGNAVRDGDDAALHRSWDMARKTIELHRVICAQRAQTPHPEQ